MRSETRPPTSICVSTMVKARAEASSRAATSGAGPGGAGRGEGGRGGVKEKKPREGPADAAEEHGKPRQRLVQGLYQRVGQVADERGRDPWAAAVTAVQQTLVEDGGAP